MYEKKIRRINEQQAEYKTQISLNKNRVNKTLNINTVRNSMYSKNSQSSRK